MAGVGAWQTQREETSWPTWIQAPLIGVDRTRFKEIRDRIARIPRVKLALTPTPIQEAPNLTRALGGPRIFIKRDDLTSLGLGGNKLRNLEFRLARTMAENADTVIVGLDLQSNSARQTVAACNKLGLKTILVLEGSKPNVIQGNLLMDYLLGAEVRVRARRGEAQRAGARRTRGRSGARRRAAGRIFSTTTPCSMSRPRRPIWKRRWKCWNSWIWKG